MQPDDNAGDLARRGAAHRSRQALQLAPHAREDLYLPRRRR